MIFLFGAATFFISSLYFLKAGKKGLHSAFFVSFVTFISYLVMLQGSFVSYDIFGQEVYFTRWIFYAISCGFLMLEMSKLTKTPKSETFYNVLLTIIVMLTGAAAAVSLGMFKWIFFLVSSFAYIVLLKNIYPRISKKTGWLKNYLVFGWTGFPVVFLLAPAGLGLIGAALANTLYFGLDVYTKIVFSMKLK